MGGLALASGKPQIVWEESVPPGKTRDMKAKANSVYMDVSLRTEEGHTPGCYHLDRKKETEGGQRVLCAVERASRALEQWVSQAQALRSEHPENPSRLGPSRSARRSSRAPWVPARRSRREARRPLQTHTGSVSSSSHVRFFQNLPSAGLELKPHGASTTACPGPLPLGSRCPPPRILPAAPRLS